MKFLIALAIIVGGVVLASAFAALLRRRLSKAGEASPLTQAAGPLSSLVFWLLVAVAIIAAVSVSSPDMLRPIPADLIRYLPQVMVAGLFLIAGRVLGVMLATAVIQAARRATGEEPASLGKIISAVITALSVILALAQLGIDTAILQLLIAGVVFALALSSALLVGLGGQQVARELAAGRATRGALKVGHTVEVGENYGTIERLHPTQVEIRRLDGRSVLINYTEFMNTPIVVENLGSTEG